MRDLSLSEYRALAELRHRIRKFLHFSESQARACRVEPQQHQLLLAIKGLPEGKRATISELAGRLHLKHHSTVELVDRVVGQGAVVRAPSNEDRREVIVELTRAGAGLLRRLSLAHRRELVDTAPQLARSLRALMLHSRKGKVQTI